MKVECYGGDGWSSNCYLITDDQETYALLLDPSISPAALLHVRGRALPPCVAIVLSHAHFDHMLQIDQWRATGLPLWIHEADAPALSDGVKNVYRLFTGQDGGTTPAERLLQEGDRLPIGTEFLTVLHTPGHTPGGVCLYAPGILMSGDTLFAGDIGRADLPGGDSATLLASLRRLADLPKNTRIYPGHGPASTIEREKKYNPYIGD